jgi:ALG6, ALG8 glycosyltransferase family
VGFTSSVYLYKDAALSRLVSNLLQCYLRKTLRYFPVDLRILKCIVIGSQLLTHYPCQNGITMCASHLIHHLLRFKSCQPCRPLHSGVSTFFVCTDLHHSFHSSTALDYPPFFAYFEKLLSIPAFYIDPLIVSLNNLNYDAWSVVVYQRSTVIITELVLGLVLLKLGNCPFLMSWN